MAFITQDWLINHWNPPSEANAADSASIKIEKSTSIYDELIESLSTDFGSFVKVPVGNDDGAGTYPDLADYWRSFGRRQMPELQRVPPVDFPDFPAIHPEED